MHPSEVLAKVDVEGSSPFSRSNLADPHDAGSFVYRVRGR